jgi:YVTN family beta-propeller protein
MKTKKIIKIIIFTGAMALLLSAPFTYGADIYHHTVIATIPVGNTPVGVGINPKTNLIYVSNLNSGNVSVIDGYANSVIDFISVGNSPRGIGVNVSSQKIRVKLKKS